MFPGFCLKSVLLDLDGFRLCKEFTAGLPAGRDPTDLCLGDCPAGLLLPFCDIPLLRCLQSGLCPFSYIPLVVKNFEEIPEFLSLTPVIHGLEFRLDCLL
jgi:hypothetical protein